MARDAAGDEVQKHRRTRELARIQQAIRDQRYRISSHANEEMSDDDLEVVDIEQIILTGRIARRFTRDLRGTRYEVLGQATDGLACGRGVPISSFRCLTDHHSLCGRGMKGNGHDA